MEIAPMTVAYAAEIATWRYPAPYHCYDMTGADSAFLASPASGYFALTFGEQMFSPRAFRGIWIREFPSPRH